MDNPKPLSMDKDLESSNSSIMTNNNHKNDETKNTWVRFDENDSNLPPNESENKSNTAISMETVIIDKENNSNTSKIDDQQFATIDLTNTSSIQINDANYQNDEHGYSKNEAKKQPQLPVTNSQTGSTTSAVTTNANNPTGSKSNFANGDIIVTLYPLNDSCSWITPATFKAHLVPEELMAQPLTLTVEDYVSTMSILLSDYRFHLYIILHRRILTIWFTLSIIVLLGILSSGQKGLSIFIAGILWLVLNAAGIFLVIFIKNKLYKMLEDCMAQINFILGKHNIFLGVDDRGHFSCHKINLIFVYFDPKYCIKFLQDMLKNNNQQQQQTNKLNTGTTIVQNNQSQSPENNLMIIDEELLNDSNIYLTNSSGTTKQITSQKEKQAQKLLYRYSQRWIREYSRQRMNLSVINPRPVTSSSNTNSTLNNSSTPVLSPPTLGVPLPSSNTPTSTSTPATPDMPPRHCRVAKCFCQYIEELYRCKQQQTLQTSFLNICIP